LLVCRGKLIGVRVVVIEIGWDGRIRRRALDTCNLTDPGWWENLIEQVLAVSPPYRATAGSAVYILHAGDRAVLMGEQNLIGSLRDLVTTIMAAGDPALAAGAARAAMIWRPTSPNWRRGSSVPGGRPASTHDLPSWLASVISVLKLPVPGCLIAGEVTCRMSCHSTCAGLTLASKSKR
jgi:hypothetical protein